MSYQQKYLKYKSKYLALKSQDNAKISNSGSFISNLVQLGGSKSIYGDNSLIEILTATPSLTEIWGGSYKNNSKDINSLVKLLSESEEIITTEFSLDGGSEPSETNQSEQSEQSSEQSEQSADQSEQNKSASSKDTKSAE